MFVNVSLLEVLWVVLSTSILLVCLTNLADAHKSCLVLERTGINGPVRVLYYTARRAEVVFVLGQLFHIGLGVTALVTPEVPRSPAQWAFVAFAFTVEVLRGGGSIHNRLARTRLLRDYPEEVTP